MVWLVGRWVVMLLGGVRDHGLVECRRVGGVGGGEVGGWRWMGGRGWHASATMWLRGVMMGCDCCVCWCGWAVSGSNM